MGWLIFCLTLLMTLANFGDFLFGDRMIKPVRDAAFRMYLKIEEGNWRPVYQAPAAITLSYAHIILNTKAGALAAVARIIAYSLLINVLMSLIIASVEAISITGVGVDYFVSDHFVQSLMGTMMFSIPGNVLGDIVSWSLALGFLRRMKTSSPFAGLGLMAIAIPLLLIIVMFAIFSRTILTFIFFFVFVLGSSTDGHELLITSYGAIVGEGDVSITPEAWLSVIQVMLPVLLFFAVSAIGLIIYASRTPLRRPLAFLLAKIEASPKSILTLGAAALSAIITLLAAWLKATSS